MLILHDFVVVEVAGKDPSVAIRTSIGAVLTFQRSEPRETPLIIWLEFAMDARQCCYDERTISGCGMDV